MPHDPRHLGIYPQLKIQKNFFLVDFHARLEYYIYVVLQEVQIHSYFCILRCRTFPCHDKDSLQPATHHRLLQKHIGMNHGMLLVFAEKFLKEPTLSCICTFSKKYSAKLMYDNDSKGAKLVKCN